MRDRECHTQRILAVLDRNGEAESAIASPRPQADATTSHRTVESLNRGKGKAAAICQICQLEIDASAL